MDKITVKDVDGNVHSCFVNSLIDVSDGYHTIESLYEHRCLLFIALCKYFVHFNSQLGNVKDLLFYKMDSNAPDWFILYLEYEYRDSLCQISYHVPIKYLSMVDSIAKYDPDHVWDGHTSEDVIGRVTLLINNILDHYKDINTDRGCSGCVNNTRGNI